RKGEMKNMISSAENVRLEFMVPSRGLIGFRNEFITQTKGTGILHHNLAGYEPFKGELPTRTHGALVATDAGDAVPYAIFRLQDRGTFFIEPGTKVYPGMVVGEYSREQDVPVNVCKTKQLTNMRAAGSDENVRIEPAHILTLEQSIEWLGEDEYLEVTPKAFRIRKKEFRFTKTK
ncbi:MAG TPA: translational GTPase TypA, partial [Dehalococcoidia bacterium]|nr:translational GTPase TypA [Dehalococcoidia bacterium]